jgi:hypothetical protein
MAQRDMEDPPFMLDGARVLEFASFDAMAKASGSGSAIVGGIAVDFESVSGVVLAEDLVEGATFLLHCNDDWATVAAGTYRDLEQARAAAEAAYPGLSGRWTKFRQLTAEEAAEVESTRRFLREIAEDEP